MMAVIASILVALLGLLAAIAAALITRSVMIGNHRQAWINGLRDDLAAFFTAIDIIYFKMTSPLSGEPIELNERQKIFHDALLTHRRILMRLNTNEPLHRELEASLGSLLELRGTSANRDEISAAVKLARTILKQEWEVTKYGPFTTFAVPLKHWWRQRTNPSR